jgi:hypothetical protein
VSLTELENRYSYNVPVGAAAAAPASVVLRTRQGTTGRARGLTAAAASLSLLSATRRCCCISAALFKEPVVFTAAISSSPFLPRLRPGLPSCSPPSLPDPFFALYSPADPQCRSQAGGNPPGRPFRSRPPAASFPAGVRVAACMQDLVWLGFLGQGTCSSLLACALRLLAS